MGKRNKSNRTGSTVDYQFYKPFYERAGRYSSPSENRTELLESMYQRVLAEMCLGRYVWEGLPDTISTRFLELTLYRNGLAVLFQDTKRPESPKTIYTDKFFAVRAAPTGRYDVQDDPLGYTVHGNHFPGRYLNKLQCVPVWANTMRQADWDIVQIFAHRFAQLDRTIEINSNAARRTKILAYNENQKLTAANLNAALDRGDSVVEVSGQLDINSLLQAIDLGMDPRTISELSVLRNQEWNRCMGLLGINNSNQDKKERLVSDEVDANNDQVETARETNLQARRLAAKQFNAMYPDFDVTVEYHEVDGAAPAIGLGTESVDGA